MTTTPALRASTLALGLIAALSAPAFAQTPEEFYKGKTFIVAIGFAPGGSHDLNARIIARHLGKYLPGKPTVITQNIPGAGSLKLASDIFEGRVPTDGTFIGAINRSVVFDELLTGKSREVKFDPLKINWLGGPDTITSVGIAWHTSPVKKAEDLRTHELIIGTSADASAGTAIAKLLAGTAGFKFKMINGYPSGSETDLGMERGELDGRSTIPWGGLKGRNADWRKEKKIVMLYQSGLEKNPELPDVPLAIDFSRTPDDRKVAELFFAAEDVGYPYLAPPTVPADRLAAIRDAMAKSFKDPELIAEARKGGLDVTGVSWQRMTKVIQDSYSAPEAIRKRLRETVGEGG
jgi:hypothetical protein